MINGTPDPELGAEVADLRARLAETEETLRAIRGGEADALVITGNQGDTIHLLGVGDRVYRQFIETTGEGTATVSASGEILSCNAGLAQTLRRPLDQLFGTTMRDHLSSDDHEIFESILAHACPETSRWKIHLKTSEGLLVPVYLSATLLHGTGVEPVCCLVFTDLEEVISAEAALRESEERHRTILQTAMDGFWMVDTQGRLLEVNETYCRMSGYSAQELLAMRITDLEVVESADGTAAHIREIMTQGECRFESRHRRKDGSVFDVEISVQYRPVEGGRMATFLRDISERKRAEAENERLTVAIEEAGEPVMITDAKGRILYVNPVFETVTGYCRAEVLGRSSRILKSGEHDGELYREALDTIRAGRVWRGRLTNTRKDGTLFIVDTTISPVHDKAGRIVNYVGVERDITEQLRLAEEKARLEDHLRQAQKVEAIGRLAGGVAHDFNNLTAIVLGYGEMLLGQLRPEDPARKSVEQIIEAGRRSAALTHQLLAFSRKQALRPEVLDLNALLRNLEKMLDRLIGEDVELEFVLAEGLGRITADPGQIEQVVTNLVLNARDAMTQGGKLTVETADVELDETYALEHASVVPGRYVLFALTDTGTGMDKATMARLFEPFFTTKEKGRGTGLGLAMVYGIVKQSGGYIWAYSEPGSGSTFKVYLPRTDAQPQAKPVEVVGVTPLGGGERILLVEDEVSLRDLCEITLAGLGYRVSVAGSGLEALLLVQERRLEPELVITDVVMPGMSGVEMAVQLRRAQPGIKVLYMSGYPDDAIARHGVLEPGTPFIQKPFTERVLAVKVREVLGGMAAAVQPVRRVLMIDDDEQLLGLVYHFCTKRGHFFAGAGDSAAALAALATGPFDVLLVDLNIPGTSGDRVLREIRAAGYAAPAIVLTGDAASADMEALRPLGVLRVLQKSSDIEPLLRAIEEAGAYGDARSGSSGAPGNASATRREG